MTTTYIIAGTFDQAKQWLREKEYYMGFSYRPQDFRIIAEADQLRGLENPHGVFIGTWYQRKDIRKILDVLMTSMRETNEGVLKALKVYGEYNAGQ